MSAFAELENHVVAIKALLAKASSAHGLPDRYAASARKITVNGNTYYDDDKLAIMKAQEIKDRAESEMRADGETKRAEILSVCAARIEAFRVLLPELAAKACIELGVTGREMQP